MSCVFTPFTTDCTTGGEASLLESNPDQNIIDCNPPQFYFLSACDRDKSDWLQGASCESWLGWRVTTSDLRTGLWLRFRVTAQSGGTLSSHNLSHPEAAGNPQSSQRDRVDIIISFLSWIQAIKDEFRRMRARYLFSLIQSGIWQLFSYCMRQVVCVASESRMWIPRLQSRGPDIVF